jgi:hypothetical protein
LHPLVSWDRLLDWLGWESIGRNVEFLFNFSPFKNFIISLLVLVCFLYFFLLRAVFFFFLHKMMRNPFKAVHIVYLPPSNKLRTRAKRPLHTDRVILRLRCRADPKGIWDLIEMPLRRRPLPLGSRGFPQWSLILSIKRELNLGIIHKKKNKKN